MPAFVQLVEALIPEAWFIHDGHLYQIAMHAPGDPNELLYPWFRAFLQSLTFQ